MPSAEDQIPSEDDSPSASDEESEDDFLDETGMFPSGAFEGTREEVPSILRPDRDVPSFLQSRNLQPARDEEIEDNVGEPLPITSPRWEGEIVQFNDKGVRILYPLYLEPGVVGGSQWPEEGPPYATESQKMHPKKPAGHYAEQLRRFNDNGGYLYKFVDKNSNPEPEPEPKKSQDSKCDSQKASDGKSAAAPSVVRKTRGPSKKDLAKFLGSYECRSILKGIKPRMPVSFSPVVGNPPAVTSPPVITVREKKSIDSFLGAVLADALCNQDWLPYMGPEPVEEKRTDSHLGSCLEDTNTDQDTPENIEQSEEPSKVVEEMQTDSYLGSCLDDANTGQNTPANMEQSEKSSESEFNPLPIFPKTRTADYLERKNRRQREKRSSREPSKNENKLKWYEEDELLTRILNDRIQKEKRQQDLRLQPYPVQDRRLQPQDLRLQPYPVQDLRMQPQDLRMQPQDLRLQPQDLRLQPYPVQDPRLQQQQLPGQDPRLQQQPYPEQDPRLQQQPYPEQDPRLQQPYPEQDPQFQPQQPYPGQDPRL